jgi:hypothetical protein
MLSLALSDVRQTTGHPPSPPRALQFGIMPTCQVLFFPPFHSSMQDPNFEPVRDGKGGSISSPLAPLRASVARFLLRSRDPVERLARDAVLSQKEAQLGRMFLHVAQGVQLELEKAHRLPPPPGESHLALRLLV